MSDAIPFDQKDQETNDQYAIINNEPQTSQPNYEQRKGEEKTTGFTDGQSIDNMVMNNEQRKRELIHRARARKPTKTRKEPTHQNNRATGDSKMAHCWAGYELQRVD